MLTFMKQQPDRKVVNSIRNSDMRVSVGAKVKIGQGALEKPLRSISVGPEGH